MSNSCALVDHNTTTVFEIFDKGTSCRRLSTLNRQVALPLTIVTCGLKYRYAFCHRRTRIPFVVWRIDRW